MSTPLLSRSVSETGEVSWTPAEEAAGALDWLCRKLEFIENNLDVASPNGERKRYVVSERQKVLVNCFAAGLLGKVNA